MRPLRSRLHNGGAKADGRDQELRIGDANTMMAEGGIQAADKAERQPRRSTMLTRFGGGHFAAKPELLYKLVT